MEAGNDGGEENGEGEGKDGEGGDTVAEEVCFADPSSG